MQCSCKKYPSKSFRECADLFADFLQNLVILGQNSAQNLDFFQKTMGSENLTHMSTQTFDGNEAFTFTSYLSLSVAKKLATVVYACVRKQKKK